MKNWFLIESNGWTDKIIFLVFVQTHYLRKEGWCVWLGQDGVVWGWGTVWNTLKKGGNRKEGRGASWVTGWVPWKGGLEPPYKLWLMHSDLIFNFLQRVTDGSFLFLWKMLVYGFLAFLNLGIQIRCLQNWYPDLKSALDQSLLIDWTY